MKHELKSWFDCYRVQYILFHLQVIFVYQFQDKSKVKLLRSLIYEKAFADFHWTELFDLKTSILNWINEEVEQGKTNG